MCLAVHKGRLNMDFELEHQFRFESARFLPTLPEGHPCRRMHGHSFVVRLKLVGKRDEATGWVVDFHAIQKAAGPIVSELDHRILNEVPGLKNPTSENICEFLYTRIKPLLPELVQVSLSETPETICRFPLLR